MHGELIMEFIHVPRCSSIFPEKKTAIFFNGCPDFQIQNVASMVYFSGPQLGPQLKGLRASGW